MAYRKYLMVFLGLGLVACKSTNHSPVEVLYSSQQCLMDEASIRVLDENSLKRVMSSSQSLGMVNEPSPVVLQEDEQAILVSWGMKSNSAYRLNLTEDKALFENGELRLPVQFVEPEPGKLAAQVMTSPCLVVKAKRHQAIQKISAGSLSAEIN